MELPKIEVQPRKLSQILNDMASGKLQVPRFQRNFVWPLTKTRALLDSIYKEFPIGTFFLWRAPSGSPRLSRPLKELDIPEPKEGAEVAYILDGQQRLASLFVTVHGLSLGSRDYGRISIDLEMATLYDQSKEEGFEEDIFVYRSADNNRYVAVSDLVGSQTLMIFKDIPEKWQSAFNKAHNLFQTYPFSVVWIQEQELSDAIEIFQRINQAGKRLSRYDLICANVWTEEFNFRSLVESFNKELKRRGFGKLHETVFTQTFALILKDRCATAAELSLRTDEIVESWDDVMRAIQVAIDFASNTLGVKRAEYFPYRGIVPVLAYYFYHAPSSAISAHEREVLWNWFWRVTLSERYSSTSPSRMAEDARELRRLLDGGTVEFTYPVQVAADDVARNRMTRTTSALRNAVVCLLALRQPRSLKDGSPVSLTDSFFSNLKKAERHHIFPVGSLKDQQINAGRVHRVPNFCFIPADLNREIGAQAPSEYLAKYREINPAFGEAAASHLLPVGPDAAIWRDDFAGFLTERAQLITDELLRLVDSTPYDLAPSDRLVDEPSALDVRVNLLEVRLRDFIDHRLTAVVGEDYWKLAMPGDVIKYTREHIRQRLEKHPYEDWGDYPPGRARLDFCAPGQYESIFMKNWRQFDDAFGKKVELERHMAAFLDLRNAVKHSREPSDIQRQTGLAAMTWLERVLDKHDQQNDFEVQGEDEDEE
jgi:hypothetical protein